MPEIHIVFTEEERQMMLLALAKLSLERAGWLWFLGEIAEKFDAWGSPSSGRKMFEDFRTIHKEEACERAADLSRLRRRKLLWRL